MVIIENKHLSFTLFGVRTWEVLSSSVTFSLMTRMENWEFCTNGSRHTKPELSHDDPFKDFCMVTWCLFFTLSLLINIISVSHLHSFIPISWKNLTVMVAVFGALMSLSAFIFVIVSVDCKKLPPLSVAAVVFAILTVLAYSSESFILCTQVNEQKGYMGTLPGLLKTVQLWGGCQLCPLVQHLLKDFGLNQDWLFVIFVVTYHLCALISVVTVVVILGECTRRCLLPFDKCITGFNLTGMLFYIFFAALFVVEMVYIETLQANHCRKTIGLLTIFTSVTLLAYTLDSAFSIKQLCNRAHS